MTIGDWISVDDRLPEYGARAGSTRIACVIVNLSGIVGEGLFSEDKWYFMGVETDQVSHWMPLPEPPKELKY